jgi:hypothetical protein
VGGRVIVVGSVNIDLVVSGDRRRHSRAGTRAGDGQRGRHNGPARGIGPLQPSGEAGRKRLELQGAGG